MDFNTIIFDLDGTVIDSSVGITSSVAYALRHYGIEADRDMLLRFIGPPLVQSFEKIYGFSNEQAMQAQRIYQEYYAQQGIWDCHLYEGMEQLLTALQSKGKNMLLATSKPEIYTLRIMDYLNIRRFFHCVTGSDLEGFHADKAGIIAKVLENCRITDLSKVLMIGDREFDILAAKKIGIRSLGVLYGFGSKDELEKAGADYIVRTVEEIEQIANGSAGV